MPSKDIVNSSQLYIDEKKPLFAFTLLVPSATILDPVEYGMGFQRGETNEFVESGANRITLQEDMVEAFDDHKWMLVPEEEHLQYLAELWWDNLRCPPDQRERYIPLEKGVRRSRSGRTFYPYNLYRVDSFPIYAVDGTLTQSGTTRVWSSIPPYIWLVLASTFMKKNFLDVSAIHLCTDKCRLLAVFDMVWTPLPRVFIFSLSQAHRPLPIVDKVEDFQPQDVL